MPRPLEFYTQNRRGVKASPGGEAFGRCNPAAPTAPHPVRLEPDHLPPGEGFFSVPEAFSSIFTALASQLSASGHASPLQSIAISRYNAATFDLIRHAKRRDTFPSRGRLSPGPFGLMILFPGENCNTQFAVHKLPRNSLQIVHLISGKPTIIREKRKKTGGIPYGRFRIDR